MRLIPIIENETYDKLLSHSADYLAKHNFKKYAGKLYYGITYKKNTPMGAVHRKPHYVEIVAPRDRTRVLKSLFDNTLLRLGRDSFFSKIRTEYGNITRQNAIDFLRTQDVYQKHLQQPRERTVRPVADTKINSRWQMDHIDLKKYADEQNADATFIFVIIDTFSKYVWANFVPDKSKRSAKIVLMKVLEENRLKTGEYPRVMQSDNACEFRGLKSFFESYGITPIYSPSYTPQAQGIVERFNRTLKNAIFSHFTKTGSKEYTDVLEKIVNEYNHAYHTTIKDTPARIHQRGRKSVRQQDLVADRNKKWLQSSRSYPPLKIGDKVRISKLLYSEKRKKQIFAKKYKKQWSNEIYIVDKIIGEKSDKVKTKYMATYQKDTYGPFYRRDLQKIF